MKITFKEFLDAKRRIQMTFMETPNLKMSRAQLRRLLSLSVEACETAVAALSESGFLSESLDGALGRGSASSQSDQSGPAFAASSSNTPLVS